MMPCVRLFPVNFEKDYVAIRLRGWLHWWLGLHGNYGTVGSVPYFKNHVQSFSYNVVEVIE